MKYEIRNDRPVPGFHESIPLNKMKIGDSILLIEKYKDENAAAFAQRTKSKRSKIHKVVRAYVESQEKKPPVFTTSNTDEGLIIWRAK